MRRLLICLAVCGCLLSAPSHAFFSNLKKANRPYGCKGVKLKAARKSAEKLTREYRFAGVCSVQDLKGQHSERWLNIVGAWNQKAKRANEWIEVKGEGGGEIEVVMRCSDDPWLSNALCKVKSIVNTSKFPGFSKIFSLNESAPGMPKQKVSYPPVSRSVMTASEKRNFLNAPDQNEAAPEPPPAPLPRISRQELKASSATIVQDIEKRGRNEIQLPPNRNRVIAQKQAVKKVKKIVMSKVFDFPTYKGYRVDFCLNWGKNCGRPAADAWCRQLGFTRASRWYIAHDVGNTLVIGEGRFCDRVTCDGFGRIACER